MSARRVKVAVVGCGHMGRHHARIYRELPDAELVAVVDKDGDRAGEVAAKHGVRALHSVTDLPADVEAVTVAVPTQFHADVAIPLMERGTHVLVEKPLASDSATAQEILAASHRAGVVLQVGHTERFNPVVRALMRLGIRPKYIQTQRVSPFTFRSADVGVVLDMMIHDIDIVLHLVPLREYQVDAVGVSVVGEPEDVANARIRFSDGSVVDMTASRLALKTERRIRIFSKGAYLTMDYHRKSGLAIKLDDNLDLIRMAKEHNFEDLSQMQNLDFGSMIKLEPLQVTEEEPLKAQISSFLESIRTGGSAAVSAEDGVAAVVMAERIIDSIRSHDWGDSFVPGS